MRVQKPESEIICIANRWFIERPQSFAWCHGEQGTGDRKRYATKTHDNLLRKIDDVFLSLATDLNAKIDSISRKENSWDSFYKQTFRSDVLQIKWNFKSFPIMLAIKNSLRKSFLFLCMSHWKFWISINANNHFNDPKAISALNVAHRLRINK